MHTRMWRPFRALGLVTTLAGHGVASLVFLLSFRTSIRSVWLPQFFVLLSLATVFLLVMPGLSRHSHRLFVSLFVMLIEVVLGIPHGS